MAAKLDVRAPKSSKTTYLTYGLGDSWAMVLGIPGLLSSGFDNEMDISGSLAPPTATGTHSWASSPRSQEVGI